MPLKTHQDDLPAINLTPMIDIVFNLIIFFMVSTRFAEAERKVDVSVPKVGDVSQLSEAPQRRAIGVLRDGGLTLDGESVTLPQLIARLQADQQRYRELGVVVRGDADGPFQNVAAVLTACRQAGISEMGIAVQMGAATAGAKSGTLER